MEKINKTRGNRLAKNLYNMLCYNMSSLTNLNMTDVDIDKQSDCIDLLAHMMYVAIDQLHENNYFEQYKENSETLSKPRGEIDIVKSINSGCYAQGQLFCDYNELSIDNPTNQLIKCAINTLYDILYSRNDHKSNWILYYMDKIFNTLYAVSDLERTKEVDEAYRDMCIESQPDYCEPAIHLSYFIINEIIPKYGKSVHFIDYQDPASSIIETFIKLYLAKEYTRADSLLEDNLVIKVGKSDSGYRTRELIFDAALLDRTRMKALIIDSKDYKKQSDSYGIHQLVDYFHEFKAAYDTENFKYTVDLVLLFSDREHTARDYNKQFHPYSDSRLQTIKIRYIDFDHWDFGDICNKLISIADETFGGISIEV